MADCIKPLVYDRNISELVIVVSSEERQSISTGHGTVVIITLIRSNEERF
jgi:hypothetical protein